MSLTKVNYIDKETVITAQNLNDIQDSIINLENEVVVDVSPTAPENPKLGDLWFDTSAPVVLPSLMDTLNVNIPIEGYTDNKITISVDGILKDDVIIADVRTAELEVAAKESILEEYGKILEMTAFDGGIEVIVTEIPFVEIPMKMVVIHR